MVDRIGVQAVGVDPGRASRAYADHGGAVGRGSELGLGVGHRLRLQRARRTSVATLERERHVGPREPDHPKPVAFPRDGKPIDQRPVRLRHQRAHARYREDGGRGEQR